MRRGREGKRKRLWRTRNKGWEGEGIHSDTEAQGCPISQDSRHLWGRGSGLILGGSKSPFETQQQASPPQRGPLGFSLLLPKVFYLCSVAPGKIDSKPRDQARVTGHLGASVFPSIKRMQRPTWNLTSKAHIPPACHTGSPHYTGPWPWQLLSSIGPPTHTHTPAEG